MDFGIRMPRFVHYLVYMFMGLPFFVRAILGIAALIGFYKAYTTILQNGHREKRRGTFILPIVAASLATGPNALTLIIIWAGVYFLFTYYTRTYHIIIEKIVLVSSFFVVPVTVAYAYRFLDSMGIIGFIGHFLQLQ